MRMKFEFRPIDEDCAHAVAGWHYGGIYAFYDMEQDVEDLEELLDPRSWDDHYYAVTDDQGDLIGFFCFEREERGSGHRIGIKARFNWKGMGAGFL